MQQRDSKGQDLPSTAEPTGLIVDQPEGLCYTDPAIQRGEPLLFRFQITEPPQWGRLTMTDVIAERPECS